MAVSRAPAPGQMRSVSTCSRGRETTAARCRASPPGDSTPVLATHDEHILAAVDELLSLEAILVPLLQPSLPRPLHSFVPVVDVAVGPLGVLHPFDVSRAGVGDQLR